MCGKKRLVDLEDKIEAVYAQLWDLEAGGWEGRSPEKIRIVMPGRQWLDDQWQVPGLVGVGRC